MVMNIGIATTLAVVACTLDSTVSVKSPDLFKVISVFSLEEVFLSVLVIAAKTLKYELAMAEVKTTDTRVSSKAYRIFRELFGSIG
jgi:hypothetical protein